MVGGGGGECKRQEAVAAAQTILGASFLRGAKEQRGDGLAAAARTPALPPHPRSLKLPQRTR